MAGKALATVIGLTPESSTRLFNEIRELGYDGSSPVVRSYLDKHRHAKTPARQVPVGAVKVSVRASRLQVG